MLTVYVQRGGHTAAADRVDPEWLAPGTEAMFWILAVMAGASGMMLWSFRRRGWL